MALNIDKNLVILSRIYETIEVPREEAYLYRYFRSYTQRIFLHYVYVFDDLENFQDHTGIYLRKYWARILFRRLNNLRRLYKEAKDNFNLEVLTKINNGDFDLQDLNSRL